MGERSRNSRPEVVLTCGCKPPSTNNKSGKGRDRFGAELASRYEAVGEPKLEWLLYGIVCWFVRGYSPGINPDADNISKNVWDLLSAGKGGDALGRWRLGAFQNDKQVRLRIAAIFDLEPKEANAPGFQQLNLTGVPPEVVQQLGDLVGGSTASRHLTYIRFGPLHADAYKFAFSGGAP